MRKTTFSHLSSVLFIMLIAFLFTQCNNSSAPETKEQTPVVDNNDKKKLSVYTVDIKRTDVDLEALNVIHKDCEEIPDFPCYCVDTIPGDTSRILALIKNCGDNGTAENISLNATLYPTSRPAIELTGLWFNPDSLQQDSVHLIGFSTSTHFDAIDSLTFEVAWNWAGERTTRRDTTVSKAPCPAHECNSN